MQQNISPNKELKLTKLQEAYLVGRNMNADLGGVSCHAYMEFNAVDVDLKKLLSAWEQLFQIHPLMNMAINSDGNINKMENNWGKRVLIFDYKGNTRYCREKSLEYRRYFSHRKMYIENGQLIALAVFRISDHNWKICFDVDLLMCDVYGFQIILRDLADIYVFGSLKNRPGQIVQLKKEFKNYKKPQLPGSPILPTKNNPKKLFKCRYKMKTYKLSNMKKDKIKKWTKSTAESELYTVWMTILGKVISQYSINKHFLLNVPYFHLEEHRKLSVSDCTELIYMDMDYSENKKFFKQLEHNRKTWLYLFEYSRYKGNYNEQIFAPIVYAYNYHEKLLSKTFEKHIGKLEYMISQTPNVWLDAQVFDMEEYVLFEWIYPEELFDEDMITCMFESFKDYLNNLCNKRMAW